MDDALKNEHTKEKHKDGAKNSKKNLGLFFTLQNSAWLTLIDIYISAFQTTVTRDCSRKKTLSIT